jgi:hypothetical protein
MRQAVPVVKHADRNMIVQRAHNHKAILGHSCIANSFTSPCHSANSSFHRRLQLPYRASSLNLPTYRSVFLWFTDGRTEADMGLNIADRIATQSPTLQMKLTDTIHANQIHKNKILLADFHECGT